MNVRPIAVSNAITGAIPDLPPDATPECLMVYCARVSNPHNQANHATGAKLLRFCIDHGHWSVFEMVDWTVEIETSRAIAAQILRHRSFSFQEFSQRYSDVTLLGSDLFEVPELRTKAAGGNRQGSGESADLNPVPHTCYTARDRMVGALSASRAAYTELLAAGVASECARMVLPLCTRTRLYMKGSVRSWIHYLDVRTAPTTQKEHREVALAVLGHFVQAFPTISQAMGWAGNPPVTAST